MGNPAGQQNATVMRPGAAGAGLAAFNHLYRQHIGAVTAYFARRSTDPQTVADLTSDTFDSAAGAFGDFDSRNASPRAWLFEIAARVAAQHRAEDASSSEDGAASPGGRPLSVTEIAELGATIDAQRDARHLLQRHAGLPALDLAAVELVDMAGLTTEEAAAALGVYRTVLRRRLSRARTRLFEEPQNND